MFQNAVFRVWRQQTLQSVHYPANIAVAHDPPLRVSECRPRFWTWGQKERQRETEEGGVLLLSEWGGGTILEQSCRDDAKTLKVYKKNRYGLECCAEPWTWLSLGLGDTRTLLASLHLFPCSSVWNWHNRDERRPLNIVCGTSQNDCGLKMARV